jgi:hypothetical protein
MLVSRNVKWPLSVPGIVEEDERSEEFEAVVQRSRQRESIEMSKNARLI